MASTKKQPKDDDTFEYEDPSGDSFDFGKYVSENASFHTFEHQLYLNQELGVRMAMLEQQYDELAQRGRVLSARKQKLDEQVRSFVDPEYDKVSAELEKIVQQTDLMAEQLADMNNKLAESSMVLHFQGGNAEKYGKVLRDAEAAFEKRHGRKSNTDLEWLTLKGRWMTSSQLAAYCTHLVTADGTKRPAPSREGFADLLENLITTEQVRLMNSLQKGLDAEIAWQRKLDAGFLGRSTDLAGVWVDRAGAEGGEVVGGSSDDAADGKEDGVE